ncbi:MAG TPA: hypothetical protein VM537_02075 [Anaerolineae bacterium]|nr:hypothetical protein [Anaerolineae bacterium]
MVEAMAESPSTALRAGLDTSTAGASQDAGPTAATGPVERALAELGIEWKDVMAFGVHSERVVIIEGPVGYKRTWWLPGSRRRTAWRLRRFSSMSGDWAASQSQQWTTRIVGRVQRRTMEVARRVRNRCFIGQRRQD